MKFRATTENVPPTLQLAPMIDVVFLLLIFFVTWSQSRESELDISVPAADESKDPQRRFGEQIINLTADGRVIVNSAEMGDSDLLGALNAVAELRPDQSIILRGDSTVAYEHIVRVLNICHKAKIYNVAFASVTQPAKNP
jgi:biopolymer transport protein ExbD